MTYINKLQNFKTITGDPLDQKTKRKFLERPSSVTVPDPDLYLKDMDESIRWVGQIISVEDARTTEEHDAGLSPYTGTFQFFGGIDNSNIIDFDSKDRFSGYERVYYVSTDGNDNTAIYGKYDSPYKLINTASSAAKASGRKSIVYVTKGIYKEQSITRNGVDMFFEEGAIVWTDIDGASVINDLDSNLGCTFNIMGQGEFYNQTWNPGNDSEGFNIRYASNINFEAKKVDSVQIWGNSSVNINFQNLEILLQIGVQRNKNISFKNTFFNTPIHFANYNGFNSKIDFDLCTIDLLSDDIQSLLDIKDSEGNIIFTIQPNNQNLTDYIVDTSEMTREEVVNYQNQDAGRKTFLAAINYEESLSGNLGDAHDNYKVSFRNSVIRIKKEKCIGVRVINNYNNPGSSFYVQNLTIIDETEGKDTTAIVSGRKDTVTTPLEYGIGSVFTNCKVKEETITGYLPLEKTFELIGTDNITSEITEELTVNLGPGETLGGYKTSDIISKGTNIELVIKKLLTKAQPVSYLEPTTTLAKTPTTNYYELGSSVSITLTPTFNARDSGGIDTHVLKKNGTDVHTDFSAYLDSFVANTLGSITYSSTITYLQGACKLNNLGEQDCTGRIEAGSLTKSQTTNIILPWFYGVSDTDDVSDIYATGTKVVSNVTAELTVNSFGSGIKFMWFAVPKGSKTFTSWYRTELNQGGIGNPGDLFKAKETKLVSSSGLAQDYEDEEYDFYITSSATDSSVTTKLN